MSKHSDRAVELFKQGFNCSQSVFTAFCDEFDMDEATALKVSSGLGGGVGRLREVCGTISAASMVVGMFYGSTEGADQEKKAYTYKLVQQIAEEFKKKNNNTIICRELLKIRAEEKISYVPESRTDEYYKKRPCVKTIEETAKIIDKIIFGITEE